MATTVAKSIKLNFICNPGVLCLPPTFIKSNSICYFKIIFPKKFIMISHFGNKKLKKKCVLVVHCNINKSIGRKHTEILHGSYFWVVGSIPISYFSYFNSIFFSFLQQTYFILYQARVLEWIATAFSDSLIRLYFLKICLFFLPLFCAFPSHYCNKTMKLQMWCMVLHARMQHKFENSKRRLSVWTTSLLTA